jgi:hypothetical protein
MFGGAGVATPAEVERELARLQASLERQEHDLKDLRSRAAGDERQVQIDRAQRPTDRSRSRRSRSKTRSSRRICVLSVAHGSPPGREGRVSVNRFRLQPEADRGEYRYRMLLVQNRQRCEEFQGKSVVLDVQHDGRKLVSSFPRKRPESRGLPAQFQVFPARRRHLQLSPGACQRHAGAGL